MATFLADPEKFYNAQLKLREGAQKLIDKQASMSSCTSSFPSGYEYSGEVTAICSDLKKVIADIKVLEQDVMNKRNQLSGGGNSEWLNSYTSAFIGSNDNNEFALFYNDDYLVGVNNVVDDILYDAYKQEVATGKLDENKIPFWQWAKGAKTHQQYEVNKTELNKIDGELEELYKNPINPPKPLSSKPTKAEWGAYYRQKAEYDAYCARVTELEGEQEILRRQVYAYDMGVEYAGLSSEELEKKRDELADDKMNWFQRIFASDEAKRNDEVTDIKLDIIIPMISNQKNAEFIEWKEKVLNDPNFQSLVKDGKELSKHMELNGFAAANVYDKEHILYGFTDSWAYERYMTEEDKEIYYYVLATNNYYDGFENQAYSAGIDYLNHFNDKIELNWGKELGSSQAEAYEKANVVGKALMVLTSSSFQGMDNWADGVNIALQKATGNYDIDLSPDKNEVAAGIFRESLDGFAGFAYDVNSTNYQMLPSMALGFVPYAGQVLSAASIYASSFGAKYEECINQGYTDSQATEYANASATSEMVMEKLFSAVPGIGIGAGTVKTSIPSLIFDRGKDLLVDAGGEVLQDTFSKHLGNEILGQNNDLNLFTKENGYTFLVSLASSLTLGGGSNLINYTDIENTHSDIASYVYSATGAEISYDMMMDSINNTEVIDGIYSGLSIMPESILVNNLNYVDDNALNILIENGTDEQIEKVFSSLSENNINKVVSRLNENNVSKVVNNLQTLNNDSNVLNNNQILVGEESLEEIQITSVEMAQRNSFDLSRGYTINELSSLLQESGFTILGHGTGGNNTSAITPIMQNGLRCSHTSLMYTSIGLDTNNLSEFQSKLNNWQHQDSENIILMRLPNEYFNMRGESMDLNCERTGAFVNEIIDANGNITYYLDPKFIIGSYNRNTGQVTINPAFEENLSEDSITQLKEKYAQTEERINQRLAQIEDSSSFFGNREQTIEETNYTDIANANDWTNFDDDLGEWDTGENTETSIDILDSKFQNTEQLHEGFKFNDKSDINVVNFVVKAFENSINNGDINVQKIFDFLSAQNIKFSSDSSISKWVNSSNTLYITEDIINNDNFPVVFHEVSHMLFDKILGNTQYNAFTGTEWNNIINDAQMYASNNSNGALQTNGKMLNDLSEYATEQAKSKLPTEDNFIANKIIDYKNGNISQVLLENNITKENISAISDSVLEHFAHVEYDMAVNEIKASFKEYQNIKSISDITDAVFKGINIDLNGNTFGLYGLHGAEYYSNNGASPHEIIANFFQIKLTGTEADLNLIKNTFGSNFYNTLDMLYNYVMEQCGIKAIDSFNLLNCTAEQITEVINKTSQEEGIKLLEQSTTEEFVSLISKIDRNNFVRFTPFLTKEVVMKHLENLDSQTFDKLIKILETNSYTKLVLFSDSDFLSIFCEKASGQMLEKIIRSGNDMSLDLLKVLDSDKVNEILSQIEDKEIFDFVFNRLKSDDLILGDEVESILIYNYLKAHDFNTEIVNDYFAWIAKENAYNINVNYDTKVENYNGVYRIRRNDGTKFDLKFLNTQKLSNGNTVYSYEYSFNDYGSTSSVILYFDFNLSFMLDENLNTELLINDFLSMDKLEQSINNFGYLGIYKLISGEFKQVINHENVGFIINETANQYYDFLNNYYDLDAGNTFGVDQHGTANMAKVNPKAFKELCNKFVNKGLSYKDAIKLLKNLDNTGACSYASVCNSIFAFYKDNPAAFKNDFGFDMFTYNSDRNYYSLNTTELLADLYLYINNKSNHPAATLFEGNNEIKIVGKTWLGNLKTANQLYMSNSSGPNLYLINSYLKSKNNNLSFKSDIDMYGHNISILSVDQINNVRKKIGDSLASGKTVGLGIYRGYTDRFGKYIKKGNIRFINPDGSVYLDTNRWSEGSGHAVFVTSVVEDGVWVSSWGKKLYIPFSDLQNGRFSIYVNKIDGIGSQTYEVLDTNDNQNNMKNNQIVSNNISDMVLTKNSDNLSLIKNQNRLSDIDVSTINHIHSVVDLINYLNLESSFSEKYNFIKEAYDCNKLSKETIHDYYLNITDEEYYNLIYDYCELSENDLITVDNVKEQSYLCFDEKYGFSVELKYPPLGGMRKETIKTVKDYYKEVLKEKSNVYVITRIGKPTGRNMCIEDGNHIYTASERAILSTKSIAAKGNFDFSKYFLLCDILSEKISKEDKIIKLKESFPLLANNEQAISNILSNYTKKSKAITNIEDNMNINTVDGYMGKAARWTTRTFDLCGDSTQLTTKVSWKDLIDAGVITDIDTIQVS